MTAANANAGLPSRARTLARRRAVQAVYQWQVTGQPPQEIERQFLETQDMGEADPAYFAELLHGVVRHRDTIDASLQPCLDRALEAADPVERAILRLGAFELHYRIEVPYRVVLDEAIELAKRFGAEDGHRYVNAVLDKLAATVRSIERPSAP